MNGLIVIVTLLFVTFSSIVNAHNTTHIHPLITLEVVKLIRDKDLIGDNTYSEIYELNPVPIDGVDDTENFLYWGIDRDPTIPTEQFTQAFLLDENITAYAGSTTVIDGVVQEDTPVHKVIHHFYQGESGQALSGVPGEVASPSVVRAMGFFNAAVDWMGGYTEEARQSAYYVFGQALHHVEDMSSPAHTQQKRTGPHT